MRTRFLVLVLALGLAAGASTLTASASTAGTPVGDEFTSLTPPQTAGLPDLDRIDPVRFSYDDAVIEHFQVPTRKNPPTCMPAVNIATCPDTIWVDIVRPNTQDKVPTIMMSSPYFNTNGRGFKGQRKTPHQAGPNPPAEPLTGFPEWYDEYFVPRGYAFAAMDLRGSRNSTGCQTYGDRDEVTDAVDVVDFLAEQDWSNGKIGMTGGSYDGTIANGAAAEAPISGKHPEALAAIIPIRAIDAWYDYHFFNGVQSSGHLLTPGSFTVLGPPTDTPNSGTDDVLFPLHVAERIACVGTFGAIAAAGYASPYQDADAPFWAERDFVKDAAGFKAATFVIHGLFDFNVKPHNAGYLWRALPPALPKKLWLINGDHFDPRCPSEETCTASGHFVPYPVADRYVEANHRWWLQFLKGVEAGALAAPVEVQRRDGSLTASPAYPAAGTPSTLTLTVDGRAVAGSAGDEGTVTYADGPTGSGPTSLRFVTAPFATDTRLSGQIDLALTVATTGPDTTIAVQVDDLPASAEDDADGGTSRYDVREPDEVVTFTYAWLRAFYRDSVSAGPQRNVPSGGAPMTPGAPTPVSFSSLHTDYVVPAGHRLRFTVSNAAGGTVAANLGGTVSLAVGDGGSTVTLPVAPLAASRPAPIRPPAAGPARPPAPLPATGGQPLGLLAGLLSGTAAAAGLVLRDRRSRVGHSGRTA